MSYAAAAGAHGFRFSPWLRAYARYVRFSRTAIRFTQKLLREPLIQSQERSTREFIPN